MFRLSSDHPIGRLGFILLILCTCCFADLSENDSIARAAALLRRGMPKQAEAVLKSAVAAYPDSGVLHGALGKLLFRQKRYEDAVQELGRAVQISPDSREYTMLLAESLIGWGHFGVAVDFLNAVGQRFGNDAQYHYDLGFAFYNLNKMALAQKEVEEALRLKPDLDPAEYVLGGCRLAEGDMAGAVREFRKLVQQRPKKAIYWAALGQVLQTTGWEAEALKAVRRALALAPRDAHVQYVAATVFTDSGNFADARVYWERLEKLEPSALAVHVQLARVYSRLGERGLARKETETVNQLRSASSIQATDRDQATTTPR